MNQVFLVRHGETDDNVNEIVSGQRDVELTALGHVQARLLAARLINQPFDLIYCSDLIRARQTVAPYIERSCGHVCYEQLLREKSYGDYDGLPVEVYRQALVKSGIGEQCYKPVGGESFAELSTRVNSWLTTTEFRVDKKQTVLIVAHGAVNRTLLSLLLGLSFEESSQLHQSNACINVLRRQGEDRFLPHLLNDASHLWNGNADWKSVRSDL